MPLIQEGEDQAQAVDVERKADPQRRDPTQGEDEKVRPEASEGTRLNSAAAAAAGGSASSQPTMLRSALLS